MWSTQGVLISITDGKTSAMDDEALKEPDECEKEKSLKLRLLDEDTSPCVCSHLWSKDAMEGWCPKEEQKTSKKHASRCGNQGSLRRERTIITAPRGDFLFRHYESFDRYIKQYRENYATTCMDRDVGDVRPVFGVDLPDPYLPKISSSSVLIERIKIIEALSSYYSTKSNFNNVCLTENKAMPVESKSVLITPRKTTNNTLPQIDAVNTNQTALPTVNENDECITKEKNFRAKEATLCGTLTERLQRHQDIRNIIRVTNSSGNEKPRDVGNFAKSKKETLLLPSAQFVCSEKSNAATPVFPLIPLWTECRERRKKKSDRVLESLRIGKKVKASKDNWSNEELIEENLNLRSLETREAVSPRGGNLCLGTTIRPVPNHKEQPRKIKTNPKQHLHFPSENLNFLPKKTKSKETTFIRILGHQKFPPPPTASDSNMATMKEERNESLTNTPRRHSSLTKDYGIPLSYLRRFGCSHFHHVLEARSCKPETRKMGTAVIPN